MIRKRKHKVWSRLDTMRHWAIYFNWSEKEYQDEVDREERRLKRSLGRLAYTKPDSHKERDWMNHHRLKREQQARVDLQNHDAVFIRGCRRNQKDLFLP